jgi:hypothetical protein
VRLDERKEDVKLAVKLDNGIVLLEPLWRHPERTLVALLGPVLVSARLGAVFGRSGGRG